MQRWLTLVAVLVLIVLHNRAILGPESRLAPVFGWVPADMAYRVVWVAVGALVLGWVLRVAWRDAR